MNAPGYEQLSEVLRAAFDQAAYGKGAERHARGNDFDKQHMQTISDLLGTERGMAFQVCKKLTEGLDMEAYDRFERELLGVIIYTAGIIIWRKANNPPTAEVVKPAEPAAAIDDDSPRQQAVAQNGNTGEHYDALPIESTPIDPADVDISDGSAPSWEDAPEWANWLSQDSGGNWFWFEHPIYASADDGVWYEQDEFDGMVCLAGEAAECNPEWRTTAQARSTK